MANWTTSKMISSNTGVSRASSNELAPPSRAGWVADPSPPPRLAAGAGISSSPTLVNNSPVPNLAHIAFGQEDRCYFARTLLQALHYDVGRVVTGGRPL